MRTMHVVIGMLCVLAFAFVLFRIVLLNRVKSKLDAIRAEGYPVTLVELDEWYPEAPPGMNAATVYEDAFRAYFQGNDYTSADSERTSRLPIVGSGDMPPLSEPIPADMLNDIAWYVGKNAEAIRFLHEAATGSECRYPIDLTGGPETRLPHLAELRHGARLLRLEAILAAEQADLDRAAQAVTSSLALAHSIREEPVLISHLVRMACHSLSCTTLERVLSRASLSDEPLAQLASALANEEDVEAMTRIMVAERCMGIGSFRAPGTVWAIRGGASSGLWQGVFLLYSATGVRDMDHNKYLEIMNAYVNQSERPFPERLALDDNSVKRTPDELPRYYILTQLMVPALKRASQEDGKAIARLRCARLAVAVERYRLSHGTLPESIDALVPEFIDIIPIDPFDGNPLRLRKLEKGFVVYSVGMNQNDDSGTDSKGEPPSKYWEQPLDILFTVEK